MTTPEPVQPALSIDPITFEVVRNALVEATEEMSIAPKRSAFSTNSKTRADYSCAFFDRDLRPVAQAFTQPVHLGSLSQIVPQVIGAYRSDNILPGDGILANDPYLGGVHLNDIKLISPVHYQDRLFGYVASLAHHVDVGGGAPASIGAFREVFQEDIVIPDIKLVTEGRINDDLFRLVLAQIRSKRETAGDFRAQIAANTTGARRIQVLLDRMGLETIESTIELSQGDVVSIQSCGGGGFGPPEQRDPQAVLLDVRDEKVSLERAREIYRVVVDPESWTIDVDSTELLRADSSAGQ